MPVLKMMWHKNRIFVKYETGMRQSFQYCQKATVVVGVLFGGDGDIHAADCRSLYIGQNG